MDGVAATRAIRAQERAANRSRTPIVMLTANATKGHQLEALEAGADLHLTKPVTIEALYKAMETCLAQQAQLEEFELAANSAVM